MCGRFLTPDRAAFERHWGLAAPVDFVQSYNVAPSQTVPVIRHARTGERIADTMVWGFRPDWAKRAWINARSETVFESRAFERAALRQRCLVPAMGWYEWQGAKAPKQPYVFHLNGFVPFAFAGIWTARRNDADWVRSFAILTRPALAAIRNIHDRMPVVLDPDAYEAWLGTDVDVARQALAAPLDVVQTYPVSAHVNKPQNDDAQCIAPVI